MNKPIFNQFSAGIASLVSRPTHEFEALGTGLQNFGKVVDNQERKEKEREKFDFEKQVALKADSKKDLDFTVKHDRIKQKVADNGKLAKLIGSGQDFDSFVQEHGDFQTPTAVKIARDFTDKNKAMMKKKDYEKQWSLLSTDSRFINNGQFDFNQATQHMGDKIRKGEMSPELGLKLLDGLHRVGNYGIYAKPVAESSVTSHNKTNNTTPRYSPTEAKKAYLENVNSIYDPEKRKKYQDENPFLDFREKYNQTKKMTGGISSTNLITKNIDNFAYMHNIKDFSNFDFDKALKEGSLKPNHVANLQRIMQNSKQAAALDREMSKTISNLGTIQSQAQRFAEYANKDNIDTNIFKNTLDGIKTYIPSLNYDQDEIENEAFRRDFLNFSSTSLKMLSGLTVSDKERANFEKSMGTLSKNKQSNLIGVKQKLIDTKNALEGYKMIDSQFFNIKYGSTLRNINNSISIVEDSLKDENITKSKEQKETDFYQSQREETTSHQVKNYLRKLF